MHLVPDYSFTKKEEDLLKHLERLQVDFKYFFCHIVLEAKFGDNWREKYKLSPSFIVQSEYVVAAIRGDMGEIAISIPPRNSKSLLWSIALPMFLLMRDGADKILNVSHHREVLDDFHASRKLVYEHPDYQKIIDWHLTTATTETFRTSGGGHVITMTMANIRTGQGAYWVIVDDPISATDAENPDKCKRVCKKFTAALWSRSDDKKNAKFIVVSQRLSDGDVINLVTCQGDYQYLELQAIAEEKQELELPLSKKIWVREIGDVLNPDYEPLEVLRKIQQLDPDTFQAQYQQRPVVRGNNILDLAAIGRYVENKRDYSQILMSVDSAGSVSKDAANWGVIVAGLRYEKGRAVLDVLYCQAVKYEYPEGKRALVDLIARFNVTLTLIENQSTGISLIPDLRQAGYKVHAMPTKGSKEERFLQAVSFINQGRLSLPEAEKYPYTVSWANLFVYEIQGFPRVAKKDLVDALSHLCIFVGQFKVDLAAFYRLNLKR